jgi:hypothetical protein
MSIISANSSKSPSYRLDKGRIFDILIRDGNSEHVKCLFDSCYGTLKKDDNNKLYCSSTNCDLRISFDKFLGRKTYEDLKSMAYEANNVLRKEKEGMTIRYNSF